jgi:hypothetical protein
MISAPTVVPPDLMKAALDQPENVRARLASALIESLHEEYEDPEIVSEAWKTEIAKRIADIKTGNVKWVDGHATLLRYEQELRARLVK